MTKKEITVAFEGELKDGEVKQVSVNGTDILLARVKGQYHALGANCTLYGCRPFSGTHNEYDRRRLFYSTKHSRIGSARFTHFRERRNNPCP